jgi:hypothetical protein
MIRCASGQFLLSFRAWLSLPARDHRMMGPTVPWLHEFAIDYLAGVSVDP